VTLLLNACEWLAHSAVATYIRESDNLFSVIETVHVLAIVVTAGTIALADLRILGLLLTRYPVSEVLRPLTRMTWRGFSVMAATGLLLFWSEADKLYFNQAFRLKLLLLVLAAVNQWRFHATHNRDIALWGALATAPLGARLGATVSLGLWLGIIVLGRAIAYL
jgi:hypothetical protein